MESISESNSSLTPELTQTPLDDSSGESLTSLAEVIQESQANLTDAPAPIKNKGGRPKGAKTRNRTGKPSEPASPPPTEIAKEKVSVAPMLGVVAGVPFELYARKTGFSGFKLNQEEALGIGDALEKVMDKYFPDLGEKAGVEAMAAFTIISVVLLKSQDYAAHLENEKKNREAIQTQTVTHVNPASPATPNLSPEKTGPELVPDFNAVKQYT